jgi:predicted secreted hydrolase
MPSARRYLLPACCALALVACDRAATVDPEPSLSSRLGSGDASGFARAVEPRQFRFPADHGPHPAFRNEWWYFTGNLQGPAGRRLGYQLTLFRVALQPERADRASDWATRDVWMGHLAVSDAGASRHEARERFARGAAGLAGARIDPIRIWLEDWQIDSPDGRHWRLQAREGGVGIDLELESRRPPVLQGEDGLSRKSAEPGNASYYYSLTRLATRGQVLIDGDQFAVTGSSWLDREWSTSVLADDQAGWDWFALQFEDGRDLMYYRLRRTDGTADPMSAGSLVAPDGAVRRLGAEAAALRPMRWWTADDGTTYPVAWEMQLPGEARWRIEAVFDDQRMDLTVRYWEGMVTVTEAATGAPLGRGYMELAGY